MRTKNTEKKLFLLDAYALIFRAYFAFSKNPRINSKGLNTSAIFGFVNAMLEIIEKEKPSHLAVVFDPGTKLKRTEVFSAYKANRNETPEDIKLSIPYIFSILKAMNIPTVKVDGYEADDVIGTLAKEAEEKGYTTYMMTPDKDFGQLVTENIFMYKPGRMGNPPEVMGVPEVCEKFGVVRVDQVIDILGLWGDAVDNIPGVPGIGEKTSKKLIGLFDTMEGIYENLDQLKGKQLENFTNFKEQAFMSKDLATIDVKVPHDFQVEQAIMEAPNKEDLKELFTELEFRRLAQRILGESIAEVSKPSGEQMDMFTTTTLAAEVEPVVTEKKNLENTPHTYILCDTEEKISNLVEELTQSESFCFDTETTSLNVWEAELVGIAFSMKPTAAYYVPLDSSFETTVTVLELFKGFLADFKKEKVGHNLKYDINVLKKYGVPVHGPIFDTMVAHYLLHPDNNRRSMDVLAENELNYSPMSIIDLIGKKGKGQKSMREVDVAIISEYACEDADITLQLKQLFSSLLKEGKEIELFQEMEMPLVSVLGEMEEEGINLDVDLLNEFSKKLAVEIDQIEEKIYQEAGMKFLISSPKQVGEVLFDHLKITEKAKKTKTGQYATGEEILQKLKNKHPVVDLLLEYREVVKLKNTYVDPLPELVNEKTKRLHTSYNQVVAATGRLSSDKPNLQNIPIRSERGKEIRKAFIPRDSSHVLVAADYSQIELRIIAALSNDQNMLEAFNTGQDIHASTAAKVYGINLDEVTREQRSHAKMVNFGIIYGISAFGLSQRLNISRKEAKQIIDSYFEKFPGIKVFMDKCITDAREVGYVETIKGRKRFLRDINSANAVVRGFAERNAINSPIQGSAADMIKLAMINIQRYLKTSGLKSKMILQVHDELIFDAPKEEVDQLIVKVKELMSQALSIGVPMDVDANPGENWLQAH
ncbi:MAG: DNA polymerase-1 [Salibacteraceae bacterium]|jgi:DNA polymerase-1